MTPEEFRRSPDAGRFRPPLRALWHDAQGDWDAAHRCVQDDEGAEAAWVHAYLHRQEGDAGNAAYWYARAGKPVASGSLENEWRAIAASLLGTLR